MLELKEIPVSTAINMLYGENPNEHDIGLIAQSIAKNGYRLPAAFDSALDAIVAGNGRIKALYQMWRGDYECPRGITATPDGDWLVPILFGVDADTYEAAVGFLIDANNVASMGAPGKRPLDVLDEWGPNYIAVLEKAGVLDHVLTVDADDLALMKEFAMGTILDEDPPPPEPSNEETYWVRFQVANGQEKDAVTSFINDVPLEDRANLILGAML